MNYILLLAAALLRPAMAWKLQLENDWTIHTDDDIVIRAGDPVTYTAGVLEYRPYEDWTDGGEGIIRENTRIIAQFAAEAKAKGVDILVAPEYGTASLAMHILIPEDLFSLMQYVPDPELNSVPCTELVDPPNVEAIRTLSCAALENEMYLVVDVSEASPCRHDVRNPFNNTLDVSRECPSSGYIYYNTLVVFDRDGRVVVRYRKKNLFGEPQFVPGTQPNEESIFVADFGVTFTIHICFDVAYYNPTVSNINKYGIKDVIMSTAWVDILPFYTASSIQNTWSRGLGVNLLVSGYHKPEIAKMGSGIYRGASDLVHNNVYDTDIDSKLLVLDVDSVAAVDVRHKDAMRLKSTKSDLVSEMKTSESHSSTTSVMQGKHKIYHDNISNYTHVPLVHGESQEVQYAEACHDDGLCCNLTYFPTSSLNYSLVAYSGFIVKDLEAYHMYAQVCSIMWCQTEDINTCTHIEDGLPQSDSFGAFTIHGNFSVDYVFPSAIKRNLSLIENDSYALTNNGLDYTMTTTGPTSDVMVAGMFARWYSRDPR